jgi:mannose-1-phosphate guanylyltransferase
MKIIVTAGGQGTKMWPLSRSDCPKQFQAIIGERTLFQETIDTLLTGFSPDDIYISTKRRFIGLATNQAPTIPLKNFIVEPDIAKDRGPGEGLAFLYLSVLAPNEPFMIVQADVLHQNPEKFIEMIKNAEKVVKETGKMITGGIKALEASIGVDYLELGEVIDKASEAYYIKNFIYRKKTVKETRELIDNFHIVTHCNHTCWYPEKILEAYQKFRPDWHESLMKVKEVLGGANEVAEIERIYSEMEAGPTEEVTINVMNSDEAIVMLLPYKWVDIGTWGSVLELEATEDNNYFDGEVISESVSGSLIKGTGKKIIAVAGVKDLIIVDTEDALLIVSKDEVDKIKNLQNQLKDKKLDKVL